MLLPFPAFMGCLHALAHGPIKSPKPALLHHCVPLFHSYVFPDFLLLFPYSAFVIIILGSPNIK